MACERFYSEMDGVAKAVPALNARECQGCLRPALDTLLEGCQFISFDWKYLYVNPAAAGHGKRERSELIGRSMFECFPGIETTEAFAALKKCMETRQAVRVETEFVFPNGAANDFELSVMPIAEGICVLSNDITERKKLERELLEVIEDEQARIGQDLHDGICQSLVGIEFQQAALAERVRKIDGALAEEAAAIGKLICGAVTEVRAVARGLSPLVEGREALADALSELARTTRGSWGRDCEFSKKGRRVTLDYSVATHLFRIAQEAVSNAMRHGDAKRIEISLETGGGKITLRVKDNGVGVSGSARAGMGQRTMRHRANLIGGQLILRNGEGGGAEVICALPTGWARAGDLQSADNYEL